LNIFEDQAGFMELAEQTIDKLDREQADRYVHHCNEEFNELLAAEASGDQVELLDALTDLIVVSAGALISLVGPERAEGCWDAVYSANLRKVSGGRVYRPDGQLGKPEGWHGPSRVLENIAQDAGLLDEDN
jgi:predicted HAD superfamily Cof-like phosphohydrolase